MAIITQFTHTKARIRFQMENPPPPRDGHPIDVEMEMCSGCDEVALMLYHSVGGPAVPGSTVVVTIGDYVRTWTLIEWVVNPADKAATN